MDRRDWVERVLGLAGLAVLAPQLQELEVQELGASRVHVVRDAVVTFEGRELETRFPGQLEALPTVGIECPHGYDVCPKCDRELLESLRDRRARVETTTTDNRLAPGGDRAP